MEHRVGGFGETFLPVIFLGERLDDVHSDDALLGDDRDIRELLLDVAEYGLRDAAVVVGDEDDRRRDRERDESELPAVEEEHAR